MKWKDMTAAQRIIYIAGFICCCISGVIIIFAFTGLLPDITAARGMLGVGMLCHAIGYWKKNRVVTICYIIAAVLMFATFLMDIIW